MQDGDLLFIGMCDISGLVRGKTVPARERESRFRQGIGWTPTSVMISTLGPIWDSPFGTAGDLALIPDPTTEVTLPGGESGPTQTWVLGSLHTPDGRPWECCPRQGLVQAIADLEAAGLTLRVGFEHEFHYSGGGSFPGSPYSLRALREQDGFGAELVSLLSCNGLEPDTFLAEYGDRQFEATLAPAPTLVAADRAVLLRELARSCAHNHGERVSFSPMPQPDGAGNGFHTHFSLWDLQGRPLTAGDDADLGLSVVMQSFCAGIQSQMAALCGLVAPTPVSYLRLTPNRWAPTVADIARQERGAALRICPTFAGGASRDRQSNVEFRIPDGAANPYLVLTGLIRSGLYGLQQGLVPRPDSAPPLPTSLEEALTALELSPLGQVLAPTLLDAYLRAKRAEAKANRDLEPQPLCDLYRRIF